MASTCMHSATAVRHHSLSSDAAATVTMARMPTAACFPSTSGSLLRTSLASPFILPPSRLCRLGGDVEGLGALGGGKKRVRTTVKMSMSGRGGGNPGDGFKRVVDRIGQVQQEDNIVPFGPPPPTERDAGSGFINLSRDLDTEYESYSSRMEDRQKKNNQAPPPSPPSPPSSPEDPAVPKADATASGEGQSAKASPPSAPGFNKVSVQLDTKAAGKVVASSLGGKGASGKTEPPAVRGKILPSPLNTQQRVAVAVIGVLTISAFGQSAPAIWGDNLAVGQAIVRFIWGTHTLMGAAAAYIATTKDEPPFGWFIKVTAIGTVALKELLDIRTPEKQ